MAETCEEANVLCSLDELNGYSCNNPSSVPSHCSPLCSQSGIGHNTSWWAFVCAGGEVQITLTIGGCLTNQGLQFGIWGDCSCSEEIVCQSIPCLSPGSVTSFKVNLKACKTYYLWIDGCSGDICDFTINSSLGGCPGLVDIGSINDLGRDDTLEVCVGACQIPFFVKDQPKGCSPNYAWTCHGMNVGGNEREIWLDFPNEGDFEICATAYIGNLTSGSICSQSGTSCLLVRVRKWPERKSAARTLCWEQVNDKGFKWHDQRITTSGTYRQKFIENNCCSFDSVVEFTILDKPVETDVYYISVRNKPYVDFLGRSHYPCLNRMKISLPGKEDIYGCDSAIYLTAVNIDPKIEWNARCKDNKVELNPLTSFNGQCNLGESYAYDYRWFLYKDPLKQTISTEPRLLVNAENEIYCIEVTYTVRLGNILEVWTEVYCDTIDEVSIKNAIQRISLSACDSLIYKGKTYFQSTQIIEETFLGTACQDISITDLIIHKSSSANIHIRACDSAVVNGVTYFQSGSYTHWLENSNLCDSILRVDVEIYKSSNRKLAFTACDSISLGTEKYYDSGNYTQFLKSEHGCDSIINLDISLGKSNTTFLSLRVCDSAIINGAYYNQSGRYSQILKNTRHCDSTVVIDLEVNKTWTSVYVSSGCDSAVINGMVYKQGGSYTQYLNAVNLCDSIIQIELDLSASNSSRLFREGCDSININGSRYLKSGHYTQYLKNVHGCDSTLYLDLTVRQSASAVLNAGSDLSICEGDEIILAGEFSGIANFLWKCSKGYFDHPDKLSTKYYVNSPGQHRVYLEASDECKHWLDSLELKIYPKQQVIVTGDTILQACEKNYFTAFGGENYRWIPRDLIDCLDPACSRVELKPLIQNTVLNVSTAEPCGVPAILNLLVKEKQPSVFAPNVFSPNGDNSNDVFYPILDKEQIHNYQLQVFDRWGSLVFESTDINSGWDGKFASTKMTPGVFPYVIQFETCDGRRILKSGDVTLIR